MFKFLFWKGHSDFTVWRMDFNQGFSLLIHFQVAATAKQNGLEINKWHNLKCLKGTLWLLNIECLLQKLQESDLI